MGFFNSFFSEKKDSRDASNSNQFSRVDNDFMNFVRQMMAKPDIKYVLNTIYNNEYFNFRNNPSFGPNGSKEFVAAICLSIFQDDLSLTIEDGYRKVFKGEWTALGFSDFMDNVIKQRSVISYSAWSAVYRYLSENHKWIENLNCAEGKISKTLIFIDTEEPDFPPYKIATLIGLIGLHLPNENITITGYSIKPISEMDLLLLGKMELAPFLYSELLEKKQDVILKTNSSSVVLSLRGRGLFIQHLTGSQTLFSSICRIENWGVFSKQIIGE